MKSFSVLSYFQLISKPLDCLAKDELCTSVKTDLKFLGSQ